MTRAPCWTSRWLRLPLILMLAVLPACAMVSSQLIDDGPQGQCVSEAGFYYLPKSHLEVEVQRKKRAETDANKIGVDAWHEIQVRQIRLGDRGRGYCLDYLRSATAEETVSIKKYKAQPLLALVSSDSTDRSFEIAQLLIRTIFTAISGNPNYDLRSAARNFIEGDASSITMVRADYDPFDPARTAIINHTLREFGFCLILEHYTANLDALTVDEYCDDPERAQRARPRERYEYRYTGPGSSKEGGKPPLIKAAHRPDEVTATQRVLFYRPRITYQLYVFVKSNQQALGGWKLRSMHPVAMENIAPILSIGLDRTAFAQRKTTLVFDEGMLKDACHFQGSELVTLSKLPLLVAQSVVALPANILQVRIDQTNGMAELIKAQDAAIKTQTKYLARLNELPDAEALAAGAAPQKVAVAKALETYSPAETAKLPATHVFKVGDTAVCGSPARISAPKLDQVLDGTRIR